MKLSSLAEAKEEMKKRLGETEYYFAITLKETGKVIGEIDAYPEPIPRSCCNTSKKWDKTLNDLIPHGRGDRI